MAHQFVFLSSICIPMFFPASHLVVPSLFQWIIMIVTGFTMLATVILTVKLMQSERVSVVMGVMSGIIMLGTSSYLGFFDFAGAIVILVGIALVIKK
jgi:drug/metabolite transporter (DMT)-like permease